jgi:uncharacterized protein
MKKERFGDWMQTYSGGRFWPIDPVPEEVEITDIARALSMMCRYNGHCSRFYSVGEHSVIVSRLVPPEDALWGLLHDASEAYIADIVKPAKRFIEGYQAVEERIMAAVCQKFGLSNEQPRSVKYVDQHLPKDEMQQLLKHSDWYDFTPMGVKLPCWSPSRAEKEFIKRFKELTNV